MFIFRQSLHILVSLLIAISAYVIHAQTVMTPGSAINVAGRQRFLSQRMGKDYVFKLLGKQVDVSTSELQTSIVQFEENIKALKAYVPNSSLTLLAKEVALWADYRKILVAEPSKENAQLLLNMNSKLLAAANDVVLDLVKWAATTRHESGTGVSAALVAENADQAGRVRMLGQRMTFCYRAYIAGSTTPNNDIVKQIQQIATGIQSGMSSLVLSNVNTVDIDDAISSAILDWRYIEEKCTGNNCVVFEEKTIDSGEIFMITNRMLAKMDDITGMYANLLE